jgi:pimeloyl-ACP methyl ester carboxylesterase
MTVSPPDSPKLSLPVALALMEAEARHGTFVTGRYECAYTDWGEGPPLFFIHGLGDERRSHAIVMAHLRKQFRCIAYNLPMGGRDKARLRRYHHAELTTDLFRLMDHLQIQAATLLGHSFGSTIVLKAMHDQPQRTTRGILMGGFANRPLTSRQWWLALAARFLAGGRTLSVLGNRDDYMQRAHHAPFAVHEPERWHFFLEQTGQTPLRGLGHWGHQLHRLDLRPLLPKIKQPVLILCGDRDPLVPQSYQDYLFQNLPNGLMFQIADCGHHPMLTHPETVAEVLFKFVGMTACPLHLLTKARAGVAEACSGAADGNCQSFGCAPEGDRDHACERVLAQGLPLQADPQHC